MTDHGESGAVGNGGPVAAEEPPITYADLMRILDRAGRCQKAWVMDLASYKRIRRMAAGFRPDDTDEGKWKPEPGDMLAGLPMLVRDDGGEPHIEWLTREEIRL